jgi:hypothetical protein
MNQFQKKVQVRCELYNEYTKLLNSLLGLTDKQVLVLSKLFELHDTTPMNKHLLCKDNRREIMESCSINECNLSTYLTVFKQKGILFRATENRNWVWYITRSLCPRINNGIEVNFKIGLDG